MTPKEAENKKRYAQANKKTIDEYQKAYRKNNRENNIEYQKAYRVKNKEELAKKRKAYVKKNKDMVKAWYENNKETIAAKKKIYNKKNEENIKRYYQNNKERFSYLGKLYRQKNKEKINEKRIQRIKDDPIFALTIRLRRRLNHALTRYSTLGKVKKSDEYGIDYAAIINHLKPFPENRNLYHIDHIKPLCSFDFNDQEQIKEAFAPDNHQWLTAKDNLIKGRTILK